MSKSAWKKLITVLAVLLFGAALLTGGCGRFPGNGTDRPAGAEAAGETSDGQPGKAGSVRRPESGAEASAGQSGSAATDASDGQAESAATDASDGQAREASEAGRGGGSETPSGQEAGSGGASRFPATGYAYAQLTEEKQRLYLEILDAVTRYRTDAELSTLDQEQIGPVLDCVLADHPEIFYVDGYTSTAHLRGEELYKLTFSASYTMSPEEAAERQQEIDAAAKTLLSGLDEKADDYGKLKYLYDTIIGRTEYNVDAPENQNICSVFLYGESVCQGYAKAFQYLCREAGIPAVLVSGTVTNGGGHAWDLVYADGDWYYVDPTWGDAYYRMGETDPAWQSEKRPDVNYDYFLVTTAQLIRTHTPGGDFPLPECVSLKDNYYVRENAYFTGPDEELLTALFQKSYEQKRSTVTVKCADEAAYASMRKALLDDQEIFDYLSGEPDSVPYVDSEEQLTLTFWLEP